MNVYLVIGGDYDGFNIEGIYATREQAEQVRDKANKRKFDYDYDVEEWELEGMP